MKKIIRKVLTELSNEKPDLSYMRGLLEGLVDEEDEVKPFQNIDEEAKAILTNGFQKVMYTPDPEIPPAPDFNAIKKIQIE